MTAPRRRRNLWPAIAIVHAFFAVFFVLVAVARVSLGESAWSVIGAVGMVLLFGSFAVNAVRRDRAGLLLLPAGWQKRRHSS